MHDSLDGDGEIGGEETPSRFTSLLMSEKGTCGQSKFCMPWHLSLRLVCSGWQALRPLGKAR